MSWKYSFLEGLRYFREKNYEESLLCFDSSIVCDGTKKHSYDSRAAVLDKLDRPKDALKDAKKCIDLDPSSWVGYARSARLFLKIGKFNAAIQMAEHALARIDESDGKRRNEMTLLKQEAEELEVLRGARNSKTNHFDRLPTEICDMIFIIVGGKNCSKTIALSLVCRRWRDIIWNTPSLWCELTLTRRSRVKKAETWMQRSRQNLRTLKIRSGFHVDNRPGMAKVLADVAWERLESLESDVLPCEFPPTMALDKICLRELKFVVREATNTAYSLGPRVWERLIEMNWSRLASLQLIDCRHFPQSLLLSLSTLQRLVIFEEPSFHAPTLYQLLDRNKHIKELVCGRQRFSNLTFIEESIDDFQTIKLDELSVLEFHKNSTLLLQILKKIEMPNLTTLRVSFARVPNIIIHLDRLFSMRFEHLTELSLTMCVLEEQRLNRFLQGLPSLTRLGLNRLSSNIDPSNINDIVSSLSTPFSTESGETSIPCPKLESVDLSSNPRLSARPVINLVKAHLPSTERTAIVPIRSLFLNDCEGVESEALPWLRQQVEHVSCFIHQRQGQ